MRILAYLFLSLSVLWSVEGYARNDDYSVSALQEYLDELNTKTPEEVFSVLELEDPEKIKAHYDDLMEKYHPFASGMSNRQSDLLARITFRLQNLRSRVNFDYPRIFNEYYKAILSDYYFDSIKIKAAVLNRYLASIQHLPRTKFERLSSSAAINLNAIDDWVLKETQAILDQPNSRNVSKTIDRLKDKITTLNQSPLSRLKIVLLQNQVLNALFNGKASSGTLRAGDYRLLIDSTKSEALASHLGRLILEATLPENEKAELIHSYLSNMMKYIEAEDYDFRFKSKLMVKEHLRTKMVSDSLLVTLGRTVDSLSKAKFYKHFVEFYRPGKKAFRKILRAAAKNHQDEAVKKILRRMANQNILISRTWSKIKRCYVRRMKKD